MQHLTSYWQPAIANQSVQTRGNAYSPLYRHDNAAIAAVVPMFAQEYPLPGSQPELPSNRDIQAVAEQAGFQVRRQVVRAFILMPVIRLVFGNGASEIALKILAHRGVGILVDG